MNSIFKNRSQPTVVTPRIKLLIIILSDMVRLMSILVRIDCQLTRLITKTRPILRTKPSKENFMVATKTQTLEKQKALQVLNHFLDQFKNCCKQKQSPNAANFENILSHDFQNSSNGKLIGKNIQDFLKRIQEVQKKYSQLDFTHLRDCLISDNKAIIQYDMNLTLQNGEKRLLNIMAIATIDGDHITHWSQVSHDKEKDHLNS